MPESKGTAAHRGWPIALIKSEPLERRWLLSAAGIEVGNPLLGAPGITQSLAEIESRDQAAPATQSPAVVDWRIHHSTAVNAAATGATAVAAPDPVVQSQTLGTTFTGATLTDTGAFPPDSMGDVGPTQYIVAVNGRFRSFNKTTGVADGALNANPDVFFSSVLTPVPPAGLNFTSDPRIRFDRGVGRWIIVMIDVPSSRSTSIGDTPNRVLIAVSSGATITGSANFTFYSFQGGANEFADYPTLGVDANALYIGSDIFSPTSGAFINTNAYVVRKSSILSGGPIVVTPFANLIGSDGPRTPQGVDDFDASATQGYFIGPSPTTGRLVLRRVSNPGGTPTISANILLTVAATGSPLLVPHLGNTGGNNGRLDAVDDRLMNAVIRNGHLWTAHAIGVNNTGAASGTLTRDGVRWYDITNLGTTPTVNQFGTVSAVTATNVTTDRYYWIPSIMVSGQGNVAMGFSVAGSNEHINAGTTGRLAGDALNTMGTPVLYTNSTTAYNPSSDPGGAGGRRWGDYSYTSLDPSDDMTMWTIQEFCNAANSYAVQVVKLLAPLPATPASVNNAVAQGASSVNVVVTGNVVSGSGFFDPGAGFANHIAASVSGAGVTVNSVTYSDPTHITLNLTLAANAAVGGRSITVTNPDGQAMTSASGILTVVTSPPATPDLQAGSDLGTSSTDNITNTTSPTFDITGVQAGATVELLRDGVVVATIASAPAAGTIAIQDPGPAADGSRSYTSRQTLSGSVSAPSAPLVITIDTTAPQLVGTPTFQFNVGPQSVGYTFSENVGPSLVPHDFLVEQLPTGGAAVADANTSVTGTTNVSLNFTTPLADGNYRVSIAGSDVTDIAGNPLTAGSTFEFFIYAGDANHDGTVDVGDLGLLATNYGLTSGATWGQGDFNYDGAVDVADLGNLATNYGTTLAPPGSVAPASVATASPTVADQGSLSDPFWKHHGNIWGELPISGFVV